MDIKFIYDEQTTASLAKWTKHLNDYDKMLREKMKHIDPPPDPNKYFYQDYSRGLIMEQIQKIQALSIPIGMKILRDLDGHVMNKIYLKGTADD